MNLIIITAALAGILLRLAILAMRAHRTRLAIVAIVLMNLHALFILVFVMGGLRAHVMQARSKGVSDDFVAGMVERNWFFVVPRVALAICIIGLLVISIAAVKRAADGDDRGADCGLVVGWSTGVSFETCRVITKCLNVLGD